jgi:hypothetical protein
MPEPKASELAKAYEPANVEQRIYGFWEAGSHFRADARSSKAPR